MSKKNSQQIEQIKQMTSGDLKALLIEKGEEFIEGLADLWKDGISPLEICNLISALVEGVEALISESGKGELKHAVVRDTFSHFDRKYHLVDRIDNAIRLPFWLEMIDGYIIRSSIHLLISQAVVTMNRMKPQITQITQNVSTGLQDLQDNKPVITDAKKPKPGK